MYPLNCPFCSHDIAPRVFLCSKYSFGILARHGVAPGQALVIPRRHVASLEELHTHELSDLMLSVAEAISVLRRNGIASDINVAINLGEMAGQSVEHLHVHLIPRNSGDAAEPKRWLSDALFARLLKKSDQELNELSQKIRRKQHATCDAVEKFKGSCIHTEDLFPDDSIKFENTINYPNCYSDATREVSLKNGALIRSGSIIYRDVKIGADFECGHNVLIRSGSIIGSNVCLYTGTQIQKNVVIGNCCIVSGWLGNGSILGDNVKMFGELIHKYESPSRGVIEPAPEILDGAFVGWNAIVVGGVRVGRRAIVGAGSVVVSDVPDDCVVAGNPAKPIKTFDSR